MRNQNKRKGEIMQQNAYKTKERGLAHLGLVIAAVLVIAAIGFGGWWVWAKNKKDESKQSNNNTQSQQQTSTEEKQTKDPSEGGKYLVIQEWRVRFLLPEDLRGDIYYRSWTNMFENQGVSFASKHLDKLVGDDSCSMKINADGTQGSGLSISLGRIDPMNPGKVTMDYYRSQQTYIAKIGNFEYYYPKQTKNPPITCLTGQHEEFHEVEQSISDQLRGAFKGLEAIE